MLDESTALNSPDGIFVLKTANECSSSAAEQPAPGMLFGEFWRESELAILFADAGAGKSLLAMQIAESLARGHAIGPLNITAKPQKGLYFDLDLTEQQFGIRYARESEGENGISYTDQHVFADGVYRLELDPDRRTGLLTGQSFAANIEVLVKRTGAKVLVIDSIALLNRASNSGRDEVPFMRELNRLKRKYGLSILVLATSSRRDPSQPLRSGDLRAARIICNYADSVFAIGRSRREASHRYIKHLRSKNYEALYDETYVPLFTIRKLGGNFLGAHFCSFGDESDLLRDPGLDPDADLREAVKELRDQGLSYRDIGARLHISKTRAHRLRMQWQPRRIKQTLQTQVNPYDFPGHEEYDEALRDPKFKNLYEPGHPDGLTYARDYIDIENARYAARKEFNETGRTPTLAESLSRLAEPPAPAADQIAASDVVSVPPADAGGSDPEPNGKMADFIRDIDGYGKEIFVKTYTECGKPQLWYNYDSKGRLKQWERKGDGVLGKTVTEIPKNGDRIEELG